MHKPKKWRSAVIFASPHSGNIYPKRFIEQTQLNLSQLRRNEDIYIDKLFMPVISAGAPLLTANFPRCFVDVNRAPHELPKKWLKSAPEDTHIPSARAQAGIGVIPTHINERLPIYKIDPSVNEVQSRIETFYHPYHTTLKTTLEQSIHHYGQVLLIDCHSMPGFTLMGARRVDIILGDRFGKSCHPKTLNFIKTLFLEAGLTVAVNHPYAGGYVTEHYGSLGETIEAIQIEINRDLYVNPITLKPKSGYSQLLQILAHINQQIIIAYEYGSIAAQ